MPDTPGKRQRREVKAKRRSAKDDRRTAKIIRRDDPTYGLEGTQLLDENGIAVFDADGYPVLVTRRDVEAAQQEVIPNPDGGNGVPDPNP
ncbi:MAG: hypothetical protein ACRDH7_15900 [Actinomycetota bacterium]